MTLTSVLSTALTGLSASQRALGVISNNVANAQTEGYSRKQVNQSTLILEGRGTGVEGQDASRIVDEFLMSEHREQRNLLGRSQTITDIHTRIQGSILGSPADADRGIGNRISDLSSALETLANSPEKMSLRGQVISAAESLVGQINVDADRIQGLRNDIDSDIANTIDEINLDIAALQTINAELTRSVPTAELLDRRDTLLGSLSENIDISTYYQNDGTVAVLTAGGNPLLEGTPFTLVYEPSSSVNETTVFNPVVLYPSEDIDPQTGDPITGATGVEIVSGGVRGSLTPELIADAVPDADQIITSPLSGGKLAGLYEARDQILPELSDQYGELASITRYTLNRAHNDAVPFPPPNSLTGTRTDFTGYNSADNSGEAYLAVTDNLTGDVLTTIAVDATQPSPAALVAQLNTDLGAFGTAAFAPDGNLVITLANPDHGLALDESDSAIQVTDSAGHVWDYGVAHYFGLNDLIVQDGATPKDISIRPDISSDKTLLSNVVLDVDTSGLPITGAIGGRGDNRGVQQLAQALQDTVRTVERGDLPASDRGIGSYMSDVISLSAVKADYAQSESNTNKAMTEELGFRVGSVSGVNLDEELSKLIVYQQAYTVSARIISVADELFETLLNTSR